MSNTFTSPLVTVILPTRDRPHYLREALESALNQRYRHLEVLVRDNASTDETRRVVQSFSDPRIRYHRHSENVGPTENIIGGCREARGEYVASLHDDDVWEPDFLEKLVPPLQANSAAVVAFSDHYIIDADGRIDPARTHRNTHRWKRHLLRQGLHAPLYSIAVLDKSIPICVAAVMRRDASDWSDIPNLPSSYDLWLMYLACREGQAGYYLPERLTRYRVHPNSETATGRMRVDQGYIMCYERMLEDERLEDIWPPLRSELAQACADLGVTLVRSGNVAAGRMYLRRGLRLGWTIRALALFGLSFAPTFLPGRVPRRQRVTAESSRFALVDPKREPSGM